MCIALPYPFSSFFAHHHQLPVIQSLSGVENVPRTLMPRTQSLVGQRVGRRSRAQGRTESLLLLAPTPPASSLAFGAPSGGLVATCPKVVPELRRGCGGQESSCYLSPYPVLLQGVRVKVSEDLSLELNLPSTPPTQAQVRPRCGRLVAFSSGVENPHGVWAVTRGRRCALALWHTWAPEHREQVSRRWGLAV